MLRTLAQAAYVPTLLAEFGIGAMLPVFALSALSMNEPAAVASLAVAVYGAGRIGGSAWGGPLATRRGGELAAAFALAVLIVGALACAASTSVAPFTLGVAIVGVGHGSYHVARQAQVNSVAPPHYRARSLTTLAGTWRIGNFVGPIVGAAAIAAWGLRATYAMAALAAFAAIVALVFAPHWRTRTVVPPHARAVPGPVLRAGMPTFRTLGVAVLMTAAVRAARLVVIPIWAEHIGLSDQVVSLIFGAGAAIDMVLFFPAGIVMDRWGRRWTAVPSTIALTVGTIALPLTHSAMAVTAAAVLIGFGNGWGSGVLMTLGADAAPAHGRDVFVGAWSLLQDVGGLMGPLIVSAGAGVALPLGFVLISGLGIVSTGALVRWIPRVHVADAGA